MEAIAGGYLFHPNADDWDVIDNKGQVVFKMASMEYEDDELPKISLKSTT
ncbi:MAG: hypothetical protein IJH04_08360 [Eggerthellaceae bacterium]|nr:hypothetical protein [Eggerthellaceae bacterium]